MRKKTEKGNIYIIIAILAAAFIVGGYFVIRNLYEKYKNDNTPANFQVRHIPWRPFVLIEVLDQNQLEGYVSNSCGIWVRMQMLDQKRTLPAGGKFAFLPLPYGRCDPQQPVSFAVGVLGYNLKPGSDGQAEYSFSLVGIAPAQGEEIFSTEEYILYDDEWDSRYKAKETWIDFAKRVPMCYTQKIMDFGVAETTPCLESPYDPQAEIMWQGPYGSLKTRYFVGMVDSERVRLFPITAFNDSLLPLLSEEFDTDAFYNRLNQTLYFGDNKQKLFHAIWDPKWNPLMPSLTE